jgi:hypothetical protein
VNRLCLILCLTFALPIAALAADAPRDRWIEKMEIDKVTDSRMVYMVLMADDQTLNVGNWINRNWPSLLVGCENKHPVFAVGINKPPRLGSVGNVSVTSRFGTFQPTTENWESANGGTHLRMLADPINASVALTKVDKFLIRYSPKDGADVTLEFTLIGVKDHLPKIAQHCGWNYDQALRQLH